MMGELHVKLVFFHEKSSPYYPQEKRQVEAINKVLKTMIQHMVGENKIISTYKSSSPSGLGTP
jgi:hypothetical protein